MNYAQYYYQTSQYAQEFMSNPSTYPDFAKAAAELITTYVRQYQPKEEIDHTHELYIRILLNWEDQLKRQIPQEQRDYWIKFHLGIIEADPVIEDKIFGQLEDRVIH